MIPVFYCAIMLLHVTTHVFCMNTLSLELYKHIFFNFPQRSTQLESTMKPIDYHAYVQTSINGCKALGITNTKWNSEWNIIRNDTQKTGALIGFFAEIYNNEPRQDNDDTFYAIHSQPYTLDKKKVPFILVDEASLTLNAEPRVGPKRNDLIGSYFIAHTEIAKMFGCMGKTYRQKLKELASQINTCSQKTLLEAQQQHSFSLNEIIITKKEYTSRETLLQQITRTWYRYISKERHCNEIKKLLEININPNYYTHNTASPLAIACEQGNESLVALFLTYGANPTFATLQLKSNYLTRSSSLQFYSPLVCATAQENSHILQMLIDYCEKNNITYKHLLPTALLVASHFKKETNKEIILNNKYFKKEPLKSILERNISKLLF